MWGLELMSTPLKGHDERRRRRRQLNGGVAIRNGASRVRIAPQLLRVALVLLVAVSVLAVGTVTMPALLVVGFIALSVGLVAILTDDKEAATPWPAAVFFVLGVYSALQALPLPLPLLRALAPHNAVVWRDAANTAGSILASAPLSLDPASTMQEALKWIVYGAVFIISARVTRETSPRWVPAVVGSVGLVVSAVTIGHGLLGANEYFGLYTPQFTVQYWALAPLLNPNNLAGYLNLSTFCALGIMSCRRSRVPAAVAGLAAITMIAVSISCASRSGIASLLIGVAVLPAAFRYARPQTGARGRARLRVACISVTTALVIGVGLALLGGGYASLRGIFSEGTEKFQLFPWLLAMSQEYFWLGAGRGSFDSAFPAFAHSAHHLRFQYAENFLLQWLIEWGAPITLIPLYSLFRGVFPLSKFREASLSTVAASVGIGVLLVHNLLDLSLELPGVAIAVAALLGSVWQASRARIDSTIQESRPRDPGHPIPTGETPAAPSARAGTSDTQRKWLRERASTVVGKLRLWNRSLHLPRALSIATLLLAMAIGVGVAFSAGTALDERSALTALLADPTAQPRKLLTDVGAMVVRHPADPHFPLVGAVLATKVNGARPLKWGAQAVRRAPHSGRPYLLLARLLAALDARGQALRTLSMALAREPALRDSVRDSALALTTNSAELIQAAPQGQPGVDLLISLSRHTSLREKYPKRRALLEAALQQNQSSPEPKLELLSVLLDCLESAAGACLQQRNAWLERSGSLLANLDKTDSSRPHTIVPRARLLLIRGARDESLALLTASCSAASQPEDCQKLRVRVAEASHDAPSLRRAIVDYLRTACAQIQHCMPATVWTGDIYLQAGLWSDAAMAFEKAAKREGNAELWLRVASAAQRSGDSGLAIRALRNAELARQTARSLRPTATTPAEAGSTQAR